MIIKKRVIVILASLFVLTACEPVDPEQRLKALHLPPSGFKGDAAQGQITYNKFCISCHGERMQGTKQGPPLLDDVYSPKHHSDFAFHMAARDGVRQHHWRFGDMPKQPQVSPEDMENIITFVRREQRRIGIR
jgi:mono/diheme cytochrome c family protein